MRGGWRGQSYGAGTCAPAGNRRPMRPGLRPAGPVVHSTATGSTGLRPGVQLESLSLEPLGNATASSPTPSTPGRRTPAAGARAAWRGPNPARGRRQAPTVGPAGFGHLDQPRRRYSTAGPGNGARNSTGPIRSTVTSSSAAVARASTANHSTRYVPGSSATVNALPSGCSTRYSRPGFASANVVDARSPRGSVAARCIRSA
jgi:hypothetical protein